LGLAKVELILYVSPLSPNSATAQATLTQLLGQYVDGQVQLQIRDLSVNPILEADEDKVAFTPTLVKRRPAPRTMIVGSLENTSFIEDLLAFAGVERKPR
jgi:hypothetical protein